VVTLLGTEGALTWNSQPGIPAIIGEYRGFRKFDFEEGADCGAAAEGGGSSDVDEIRYLRIIILICRLNLSACFFLWGNGESAEAELLGRIIIF
jgi:hypothetical protein